MARIFIGIKFIDKIQNSALRWAEDRQNWPVRWMPKGNLHITLVPPWNEEKLENIINILNNVQGRTSSFKISFNKIIFAPPGSHPRMIWAIGDAPKELIEFNDTINKALNFKNSRQFRLHLTLARFKPESYNKIKNKNLIKDINWSEDVKSFELIKSTLQPSGAIHEVIESFLFSKSE